MTDTPQTIRTGTAIEALGKALTLVGAGINGATSTPAQDIEMPLPAQLPVSLEDGRTVLVCIVESA